MSNDMAHPVVDRVYSEDGKAFYETTKWLIDAKQHERIGYIGVSASYKLAQRRFEGFRRALDEAGLPWNEDYFQEGDFSIESGKRCIRALLTLPEPPTAVFACNDLMAIGAISATLDMGRRVPEDIAIVDFDDIPEATIIRPHLTTFAQFPVAMGRQLPTALFNPLQDLTPCP